MRRGVIYLYLRRHANCVLLLFEGGVLQGKKGDKVVLKFFDPETGSEKKLHNCSLCKIYKREVMKGNKEALKFYKDHINDMMHKFNGVTVEFYVNKKQQVLQSDNRK